MYVFVHRKRQTLESTMIDQNRIYEAARLAKGQRVTYSGFPGTVMELYADGPCEGGRMYNVRLASGLVCVCGSDLIPVLGA